MISLDTETTGVDIYHGAKPFLVTISDEDGQIKFWEWDVDPLTREPHIPTEDRCEIQQLIEDADSIVLQNGKFDAAALTETNIVSETGWPWHKCEDTLQAGHILASSAPHDLTSMVIQYLGYDITHFEKDLQVVCNEARRYCRTNLPTWRIAKEGLADMPSVDAGSKKSAKGVESEKPWKFDAWLPRALAKRQRRPPSDPYWTACQEYANADSATTLPLWKVQRRLLEERGLLPIYREKLKNLPHLHQMEQLGTSIIRPKLESMRADYHRDIEDSAAICTNIARSRDYDLELPKGSANNKSLTTFIFDVLKLPVLKHTAPSKTAPTGNPSLDKEVLDEYNKTLSRRTKEGLFIRNLSRMRKKLKSSEFFDAYTIFGVPSPGEMLLLHPSINPTATATTRLSMSNPNLQQVSKQESQCDDCYGEGEGCETCGGTGKMADSPRQVFGPAPGREWYSADAANIELRIPAYESGEPDLIALFEKPNEPPFYGSQHLLNMSIVYDDIWQKELRAVGFDKVGPHCKKKYKNAEYHFTKCGGLAMQYQCGEETADRTFRRAGGFAKLRGHFRQVGKLNSKYVSMAERVGYVETIPDRSICPERGYPLQCSRGEWGRIISTVPLNYHTQGTAGWWMIRAMNRCGEQLKKWMTEGFFAYIILTVHDELVFDFPKGKSRMENWRRALQLAKLMEMGGKDIGIPTPVNLEYHAETWAVGEPVVEMPVAA